MRERIRIFERDDMTTSCWRQELWWSNAGHGQMGRYQPFGQVTKRKLRFIGQLHYWRGYTGAKLIGTCSQIKQGATKTLTSFDR
jgi:hypothetical protein